MKTFLRKSKKVVQSLHKRQISTIPYHPAITLGNIVDMKILNQQVSIANANKPADISQENLNNLIQLKRSYDMTKQELINMGIAPSKELNDEGDKLNDDISAAASEYVKNRVAANNTIKGIVGGGDKGGEAKGDVNVSVESPVDFVKTQTKYMPLAFDSIKLDSQYFSYDKNTQTASNFVEKISSFVSNSYKGFVKRTSDQATNSTSEQASKQVENHDIAGTLVFTCTCTHKNSLLLAPLVYDADKAIAAWNDTFKDDKINMPEDVNGIDSIKGQEKDNEIRIVSGVSFGSSFVGMVHILRSSQTESSQEMDSVVASAQNSFKKGLFFSSKAGGDGIDSTFANDIKNLFSSTDVQTHCSLITMGVVPSIASTDLLTSVKQFTDFSPEATMGKLAVLANQTQDDNSSVNSVGEKARVAGQIANFERSKITAVVSAVGNTDKEKNKVLDVNSLMTAFEDYVQKVQSSEGAGVPLNYYLTGIGKYDVARMWKEKYFPDDFLVAGKGLDEKGEGSK